MGESETPKGDIEVQKLVKPGQIKSDDLNLDSNDTEDSEAEGGRNKTKVNGMPVR